MGHSCTTRPIDPGSSFSCAFVAAVWLVNFACVVGIDFGDREEKGKAVALGHYSGRCLRRLGWRDMAGLCRPSPTAATSQNYILDHNNAAGGSRDVVGPPRPASCHSSAAGAAQRTAPTPSLDLLQPLQRQRHGPCPERSDSYVTGRLVLPLPPRPPFNLVVRFQRLRG